MRGGFCMGLLFAEELPQAHHQQEDPEDSPQQSGVQPGGQKGSGGAGGQSCQDTPEQRLFFHQAMAEVSPQSGQGTADKLQQVYTARLELAHALNQGQPQQQQSAAAHSKAGEHPGGGAYQEGTQPVHRASTARMPP